MMKRTLLTTTAIAMAFGFSTISPALAAVDELVVTAQKREEGLQTVPISVKVLTAENLGTVLATGLEDISQLVPSLSMANLQRGGSQVQIRGLGSNVGNLGTVAIYNDGVISAGRIQSAGTFAEADTGLYDVEAVEVLRGPQGTLWGEGSFGGVINIKSARPNAEEFQASVSGTWSTVKEGTSENYDIAGMINVPVVEDVLAIRGVGYRYDRDGYIDGVNLLPLFFGGPPEFLGEDLNTEEVIGGRVIVSFTPNEIIDITGIYKMERTDLGLNNTASPNLVAGFTSLEPNFTQALFDSAFGSETDTDEAILEINVQTPIGQLTSITGYGKVDSENAAPAVFEAKAWSEEIRLSSDFDGAWNYTVGGYYRDAKRDIEFSGFDFLEEEITQWAIFGQVYWDIIPDVTVTMGLRYEQQDVEQTDQFFTLATFAGDFDSVIPKFAVDWQVTDETLLYASIAKGFRAGGTNTDQSLGTDPTFTEAFDADEIWNYEAGVKTTFWDGKVTINAAAFYIDWKNIQIDKAILSLIDPPLQFIVVNGEDAHSFGIEADIFISPTEDWDIVIGGSILEAEYDGGTIDSATLGFGIPLEGQVLPGTPNYVANASVERRFQFDNFEPYIRADVSLRDSSFGDVPNEIPFPGDLTSGQNILANIRGGIRGDFWEVQVFGTNIFNEYASTFTFSDGGFADVQSVVQPRTIGVNVKLRYN